MGHSHTSHTKKLFADGAARAETTPAHVERAFARVLRGFEDALLVVASWCHAQFGAVVGKGEATESVDIFAALAQSLLKPFYWRASILWTAGKQITSTEL